jgi:hypothetical protein
MSVEISPLNGTSVPVATDAIEVLRAERFRTKPTNLADWPRWNRPLEIRAAAAMLDDATARAAGGEFENTEPAQFFVPPLKTCVTIIRNLDADGVEVSPASVAERWKQDNRGDFYARGEKLLAELAEVTPERQPSERAALAAKLQASRQYVQDVLNMMDVAGDARVVETTTTDKPGWHRAPELVDAIIARAQEPWAAITLGGEELVRVRRGGSVVVMGPTGSGKTSLVSHRRRSGPEPGCGGEWIHGSQLTADRKRR